MTTILIVDDSATMRDVVELNLRRLPGVKVVQSKDGVEALERIRELPPDLVITDLLMPNMDGLELIRRIRLGDRPGTPVVVITAKGESEMAERATEAGANAFVSKPINGGQLLETIEALLK